MTEKKKRDPLDIVMVALAACACVAVLAWSGFTVVLAILAIRDLW